MDSANLARLTGGALSGEPMLALLRTQEKPSFTTLVQLNPSPIFRRTPMRHSSLPTGRLFSLLTISQLPLVAVLCCCSIGCSPSTPVTDEAAATEESDHDDHDHGDHDHDHADHDHGDHDEPSLESLAAGLTKLESEFAVIKAAFEKNSPEDAHDELHDIGHLLESLEQWVASDAAASEVDQAAATPLVKTLFTSFGNLDDTLHGVEGVDIEANLQEISSTITQLKELAK
jgi:hypothetical protein